MAEPIYYNRDGSLTGYALACGYIEQFEQVNGAEWIHVTLWNEHGVLHVQRYSNATGARDFSSYHTRKPAYKRFRQLVRETRASDPAAPCVKVQVGYKGGQ